MDLSTLSYSPLNRVVGLNSLLLEQEQAIPIFLPCRQLQEYQLLFLPLQLTQQIILQLLHIYFYYLLLLLLG